MNDVNFLIDFRTDVLVRINQMDPSDFLCIGHQIHVTNDWPVKPQDDLRVKLLLHEMEARIFQYIKVSLLLEKLRHFWKEAVEDAKFTISVDLKALIMGEPIHDTRMGSLPEGSQDDRAHLKTAED